MDEKKDNKKKTVKEKMLAFLDSIRHRFASFDTLVQLTPVSFINLCRWLIVIVFIYSCYTYTNGINNLAFFGGSTWLSVLLRKLFDIRVELSPGVGALFAGLGLAIWLRILYRIGRYSINMWLAVYLFIVEESRIKKISFWKKVLYVFTWPTFDIIGRYTIYAAIFMKVEWKPIPHQSKVTIDEISGGK